MQPDQQQRIMGYFIEEAKDHLNTIEQGLLNLQSTIEDPEMINEVFRAAHSVKGGAAMLGLNSIQRVSHRLEDFFKILKETPVRVDQKLENLFLKAFDALQELLGQLQGPFGLTEDATNQILTTVEPTFEELEQHLNELAGTPTAALAEVDVSGGFDGDSLFAAQLDSALEQLFRSEVPLRLREMLQLFKQPETDATVRQQLQEICRSLSSLGEQYQLDTWCHLVETARRAIAHPDNHYRILAPLVIRDIKLAQELVLANRLAEITPCTQLQELAPVAVISPEPVAQDDFADLLSDELLSGDLATSDTFAESDSSLDLSFDDLDTSSDLNLDSDLNHDLADLDLRHGPEVGMAELNSLADLFEGEMPELGLTWQQEEILADPSEMLATEAELGNADDSADFSDLLFEEQVSQISQTSVDDDLNDLFGDDLDEIPTQAGSTATQSTPANTEFDEFADLLNISDSAASSDSPDLDLSLDENTDQNLFELDDSTDLGLDLLDLSNSDSTPDSFLDSGSELDLEGALGDLGELFDGLNEVDLPSSTPEASGSDLWNQQQEGEALADLADTADWELPNSATNLSDAIDELGEGTELSEFDFESLTMDPIDALEGGEVISNDISADSLIPLEDDNDLVFSVPADVSELESTSLDDLSPDDLGLGLSDLIFDDLNSDSLLGDLDVSDSSDDSTSDSLLSDLVVSEPSTDEFLADLNLDLTESTNDLAGDLNLTESTTDELLGDLDLDFTEASSDNLMADLDLDKSISDNLIGDLGLDESSLEDLGTDLDLSEFTTTEQGLTDSQPTPELDMADQAPSAAIPDPWGDETSETLESTSDPLAEMGFASLSTEEDSALDRLGLEEFVSEEDLSSQLSSDLDFNDFNPSAGESVRPEGESSDLSDVFGTVTQEDFSFDEQGGSLDFDQADLEGFLAEVDNPDSSEFLAGLETADFEMSDLGGVDNAELGIGQSIETTDDQLLSDDLLAGLDNDVTADSPLESTDAQLLSDDFLVGFDGDNTSDSLDALDNLLEEPESVDLPVDEPAFELSDLDATEFSALDAALTDAPLGLADLDVGLGNASVEADQIDDFDNLASTSSDLESFGDLDDLLATETQTPPSDEFGDLDNLLDSDSSSSFADLEGLLNDSPAEEANFAADSFEAPDNQFEALGSPSQAEDFSDLESLLSDGEDSEKPDVPISAFGGDAEFDDLNDLLKDAEERMGPSVKGGSGATQSRRVLRPGRVFSEQTMRVPVKHLDNLSNLVGELVVNRNSLEQDQERLRQSLDNLLYQVQQLSDVGQRMQDLYERSLLESSLLASRQGHRPSLLSLRSGETTVVELDSSSNSMEYDPLEMDRFTGFHSLSQEMIELIVRVRESSSDIEFIVDETEQVTRMFRQVTTQLQEGLTRSRMVPFAQTADRLPRAVRDISMKVGKQAELVIEGRETLIDKMILEQLYDPMTHLVNNAITHGIEAPSVRVAAGKPPAGKIFIRAFHQGNQTIISVSDDGAGIDVERVKAKAVEKGLLSRAEAQSISRLDVYDILFHPGFSTKDQADDFSGRGVGMDVVRTSLSEIRGVINTDSNPGKGTTFTIRLPLTLSISKALCCISDRARIAFPMDGVEDMLDVPKERIQTNAEGQPCIAWRDTILPLRPLADLLGYNRHLSRGNVYGGSQDDDMASIVVLRSAGNFLALQVDQVMGEQEIVIKQLEGPVPKPVGVAGATVLGDGRIMPIADVLELIDLSMGRIRRDAGGSLWEQDGTGAIPEAPAAKTEPMVLIVDDSITVRELLSMTFNKVGYRVEQARDGQEAWEKLRSGLPCDIVFCDIEMPRMDGLELLSRIQKDVNLKHLPIAMLTSRGADRHRQMAATLGASGYFTKPYLEEALLDAAQRMLKGERLLTS